MRMGSTHTTVRVSRTTHARLEAKKKPGESFDTLLAKLVAQYDPDSLDEHTRAVVDSESSTGGSPPKNTDVHSDRVGGRSWGMYR